MVKATLSGVKRQTTTQALGGGVAKWIMKANCGVMLLIQGELVACEIIKDAETGVLLVLTDESVRVSLKSCRIYRETVSQIKSLIS